MDILDLNVFLYNQPHIVFYKESIVELLNKHHAFVVDCNNENCMEILRKHNEGHNYYIVFSDGSHLPIGFSSPNEYFAIEDMIKSILKTLNNE